jgi:DNA-binding PucR family transcriptional regulator
VTAPIDSLDDVNVLAALDASDIEVGIVGFTGPDARAERIAEALAVDTEARIGISPLYDDLRDTANALSLARIALHSAVDDRQVTLFDRDPLAIAAVSAPEVMRRVAHAVLAALDPITPAERTRLLTTFGTWLDNNGSAKETAAAMFCHPNTIRHRLRRLEERTGRSLADPRSIAELSLAFEIDRRAPTAGT